MGGGQISQAGHSGQESQGMVMIGSGVFMLSSGGFISALEASAIALAICSGCSRVFESEGGNARFLLRRGVKGDPCQQEHNSR